MRTIGKPKLWISEILIEKSKAISARDSFEKGKGLMQLNYGMVWEFDFRHHHHNHIDPPPFIITIKKSVRCLRGMSRRISCRNHGGTRDLLLSNIRHCQGSQALRGGVDSGWWAKRNQGILNVILPPPPLSLPFMMASGKTPQAVI